MDETCLQRLVDTSPETCSLTKAFSCLGISPGSDSQTSAGENRADAKEETLTTLLEMPCYDLPMTTPEQELRSTTEELERLKGEQDKAMSMDVYVGMTKEEAKRHDERRKRIYELYEALLVLKGRATQS